MRYQIEWDYSSDYYGKKVFSMKCHLEEHLSIRSFSIVINESEHSQDSKYEFRINTIYDKTGCENSQCYNSETTRAIQKKVLDNFSALKLNINYGCDIASLALYDSTKESTLACTLVLFNLIQLKEEDKEKITNFLQTGILTSKQLFEIILALIYHNKIQEAYDKANSSEKDGYTGIMFQVATFFSDRGYIQPAYLSFLTVPDKDEKYSEAQIAAAKLATLPQISFANSEARLKAIFTYCQKAGPLGQPFIDNYFLSFTKLDDSKYKLENIKTDFETLANMANIIALQNKEIQDLRKKLAKRQNKNHTNHPFFNEETTNTAQSHQLDDATNQLNRLDI